MNCKWSAIAILSILYVICIIVYVINYIVVPDTSTYKYEAIKFIFLSISAFGVLFSALLSSFNSLEASLNIQDKIEFDKTENSFAYMLRWDSPSLKEARDETRRIKKIKDDISTNDLLKRISEDESLERSVITMFNFFEEIYLSIRTCRVNDNLLKEVFADLYKNIHERFKEWINQNIVGPQKSNLDNLYEIWNKK